MKQYKDTPYYITETGEVYRDGKKIKLKIDYQGYNLVNIWKNNTYKTKRVHRLVAETYIPNPDNKPCVNHINGDKGDNKVKNLEWATASENHLHKTRVLGSGIGNTHAKSKLTEEIVKQIRVIKNKSQKEIIEQFGISRGCLYGILNNKTWKHI